MRRVLVDSAVVIYPTGAEHPLRQPCKSVLEMPSLEGCASVEMLQEFVVHRMRVGDTGLAVELAQGWAQACRLYAFDQEVLMIALRLSEKYGTGGRDAVHAATAIVHGIPEIVSPDRDFDGIEGLARLHPRDLA